MFSQASIAQTDSSNCENKISYEVSYYQGKLFKIYDVFPESNSASAFDFRIGYTTHGKKYWHQKYNYPEVKFTVSYSDYGNKEVLGNSLSVYPGIGSTWHIGRRGQIDYDIGLGLAYFNNPFDEFTNPTNNVIGSNIVAIAALKTVYVFEFGDAFSMNLGASFRHYSDGHIKVPNVGANLIYVTAGLKYKPEYSTNYCELAGLELNKKLSYKLEYGLGVHEIEGTVYPHGGPLYYVYNGSFSVSKRTSYKHQYSVGLNYNYYTDYYDFIQNQQIFYDKQKQRSSKVILFFGHEWMLNHLSAELKVGVNLYYPFRKKLIEMEMIDSRFMDNYLSGQFGFNYYLFDSFSAKKINPYLGTSIRTIGGKADFVQLSMGIKL